MTNMSPHHLQILALLSASLATPSLTALPTVNDTSTPQSLLLSTLLSLHDKVPASILVYIRKQHDKWTCRSTSVMPPPHTFFLGLPSAVTSQMLLSLKKIKGKDSSKTKATPLAVEPTLLTVSEFVDIILSYHHVWDCLPSTSEAADEYCRGLYSVEARQQQVIRCCLLSSTSVANFRRDISTSSYTDVSKFRTLLSTLHSLEESHILNDWSVVVDYVAQGAVNCLLQLPRMNGPSCGIDVVKMLEDSSLLEDEICRKKIFLENENNSLFMASWHIFEKLSILLTMMDGSFDAANCRIPESIQAVVFSSIHCYFDDKSSRRHGDTFSSLAIISKAFLVFTSSLPCYQSDATLMCCVINAFVNAPQSAESLGLKNETDTPSHLGVVPWTTFRMIQGGDFVEFESWIESLISHSLSTPTLTLDGVAKFLTRAVHEVVSLLRVLGLSATGGHTSQLAHAWHPVSFRNLYQSLSTESTQSELLGNVMEIANKCWNLVLHALAAGSIAVNGHGDCDSDNSEGLFNSNTFAMLYVEILLVDYVHCSESLLPCMTDAPGGMTLLRLASGSTIDFPEKFSSKMTFNILNAEIVHAANTNLPEFYACLVHLIADALAATGGSLAVPTGESEHKIIQRLQTIRSEYKLSNSNDRLLVLVLLLLGVPVQHFARQKPLQSASVYKLVVETSLTWFYSRVARATVLESDCIENNPHNDFSGNLHKYLVSLEQRHEDSSRGSGQRPVYLPFALSPMRLVVALTSANLLGQASQLLYSLLGLPVAMYSSGLARQYLNYHVTTGRLPRILSRLGECADGKGVAMGWDLYSLMCEHCLRNVLPCNEK